MNAPSRREFVAATAAGLAAAAAPASGRAELRMSGLTILFQGDSITDAGRRRDALGANEMYGLGFGYPNLIASALLQEKANHGLRFFNRGVSGNRVPDLDARWDHDTLALKPDILSILIGVNDLWHRIMGLSAGTMAEYESRFDALLARTNAALPGVRIVVLEPFVLRTGAVTDAWFPEFDQRRAAAARVAERAGARFIPLQRMFDRLARVAAPSYWASDGVHPTPAGNAAIAKVWMNAVHL